MSSFQEYAVRGDAAGAFRMAAINGALWAIGISWSTAIREITLLILPDDTTDAVLAELLAVTVTTTLGVTLALVIGRDWCRTRPPPEPSVPPPGAVARYNRRRP